MSFKTNYESVFAEVEHRRRNMWFDTDIKTYGWERLHNFLGTMYWILRDVYGSKEE